MDKLRASRGKKAYDAIIEAKQKKKAIIMDKNIKLLKIKDKQTQIIKKCNLHKFKPSPQMIETAFAKLS